MYLWEENNTSLLIYAKEVLRKLSHTMFMNMKKEYYNDVVST